MSITQKQTSTDELVAVDDGNRLLLMLATIEGHGVTRAGSIHLDTASATALRDTIDVWLSRQEPA